MGGNGGEPCPLNGVVALVYRRRGRWLGFGYLRWNWANEEATGHR